MIEIKEITFKPGKFGIVLISFDIEPSQCSVIIGPTGCGKTLLLETIIGVRRPDSGKIIVGGRDITNLPVEQRNIGYVPQDLAIFPHLSVEENILYGLNIRKEIDESRIEFFNEICTTLGLNGILKRSVQNLSGGELQRVAIARALVPGYKFIILDEPFSSLHESFKKELWFLIKELQKKYNLSVLLVTHNIEEAFFMGDTINIMHNGRIIQSGKKEVMFNFPESIEAARLLGITNLFESIVISAATETLDVNCNDMDCVLKVKRKPNMSEHYVGRKVIMGIRAREVMIINPAKLKPNQDNLQEGIIAEIFSKGASHILLISPIKAPTVKLECEIPDHTMRTLKFAVGQNVSYSLKSDCIFLIHR